MAREDEKDKRGSAKKAGKTPPTRERSKAKVRP